MTRRISAVAPATRTPCHSQFSAMSTSTPSRLLDELLHALQLGRVEFFVVQHIQNEEAWRPLEQPGDQVPEGAAPRLPFVDEGTVGERSRDLLMGDITLGFE